jgi:tetratricopeptide (TPR) repeat protein
MTDLLDWNEDDLTVDPEAEYRMLLNGLRRTEGFGLFFVQCSPFLGERIVQRIQQDLKGKRVHNLKLEEPILDGNMFKRIKTSIDTHEKTFWNRFRKLMGGSQHVDILFVQGLELSLLDYEESKKRLGWSSEKIFSYSWHGVPPVLINLNQQRERFRDSFRTAFVFLLPIFAVKYLVHRAPDFFDWRSGVARLPDTQNDLIKETKRVSADNASVYSTWSQEQKNRRILEIQSLLDSEALAPERNIKLHCEKGDLLAASKDLDAASASYDMALKIDPSNPITLYRKKRLQHRRRTLTERSYETGITSHQLMHVQPQLAHIQKYANPKLRTDIHVTSLNRGNSLFNQGRYEEAITAYDAALAIKPDKHEALYNKGVVLSNLGRYEEAITAYDAALAIKPDKHEALYNKGVVLSNLGRYEEAITAYDAALAIKPDKHEALYNKGVVLSNLGRYEEAITAYDAALAIKPDKHEALYNKGVVLSNLGRYEEAITAYDAALAIKPDKHEALHNKGLVLSNLGRYEEAITAYDAALAIKPDFHEALHNKAG